MVLDRLLVGALFNKKEPEVEGDQLSFEHTLQRLLKKLQQWSRIVCSTPQVCPLPAIPLSIHFSIPDLSCQSRSFTKLPYHRLIMQPVITAVITTLSQDQAYIIQVQAAPSPAFTFSWCGLCL